MDFGFYPEAFCMSDGPIQIRTLEGLERKKEKVSQGRSVQKDWIYSPSLTKRIFSLPKTHSIGHAEGNDEARLRFLIQCFGFFAGMRMTETEAGFLDATPLQRCKLTDFFMIDKDISKAMIKADDFWDDYKKFPEIEKSMRACIHNFFLAKIPNLLDFEMFNYLYFTFDACHFVNSKIKNVCPIKARHGDRIHNLCEQFEIKTPDWAIRPAKGADPYITTQRNRIAHEGVFSGEPLGFALLADAPDGTSGGEMLRQMQSLACRLMIALLGMKDNDYVRSSVIIPGIFSLDLSAAPQATTTAS